MANNNQKTRPLRIYRIGEEGIRVPYILTLDNQMTVLSEDIDAALLAKINMYAPSPARPAVVPLDTPSTVQASRAADGTTTVHRATSMEQDIAAFFAGVGNKFPEHRDILEAFNADVKAATDATGACPSCKRGGIIRKHALVLRNRVAPE